MHYQAFIGVDVSKRTIDSHIHRLNLHKQFSNDRQGFRMLLNWIIRSLDVPIHTEALICFEHTGLYSLSLAAYLEETKVPFSMISALQIKRSMGIVRGKSDRVDARRIAEYAYLYRDSLPLTRLPSSSILKLQPLLTLRDRLVRDRAGYESTQGEQERFLEKRDMPDLFSTYDQIVNTLKAEIAKVEAAIKKIISSDNELREMLTLITSVRGVGPVVGTYLIVYTHNFTRFENWRKFACYAGVAPFENQSGNLGVQNEFKKFAAINVVSHAELFGGKVCAALDRQHPRDLFDVYHLLNNEGFTNEVKLGLMASMLSHSRPLHELLKHI